MKRYLILILSLILLCFSFLYYKRIDKINIYSRYETQFVNKNNEVFSLNLYLNKKNSIYSNPNYINFELYLNDKSDKLTLTGVQTDFLNPLYKVTYNFKMLEINNGLYKAKLILKTNEEKMEFDMGEIYFKEYLTNDFNCSFTYNLQDNIKEVHVIINNTNKIDKVLINGRRVENDIKYNNLQETQELILYPYNNTYLSSLLLNIEDVDYLVVNDKFSNYYFLEAIYVDI